MENSILNNNTFLTPEECIKIIELLFKSNLPNFKLKQIYNNGGFYGFGVVIEKDDIEIMFGGERGAFSHKIIINGKQYSLYNYDLDMKSVYAASRENYIYAISILRRFLNEVGY
ncbi:hypothetical protein FACS1894180_9610 [Bacteroidia bacterium]|nr:hypothetical protein FACS1894180_9610 [Bacteroidia bacterium]